MRNKPKALVVKNNRASIVQCQIPTKLISFAPGKNTVTMEDFEELAKNATFVALFEDEEIFEVTREIYEEEEAEAKPAPIEPPPVRLSPEDLARRIGSVPVASPPAPAETPPAETPPAETPPAETPPAETPPAETPAV